MIILWFHKSCPSTVVYDIHFFLVAWAASEEPHILLPTTLMISAGGLVLSGDDGRL